MHPRQDPDRDHRDFSYDLYTGGQGNYPEVSSLYRVSLEARRGVTCLGLSIRLDLTDYHRSDSPTKDEWSSDAGLLCDTGDLNSTLIFV